MPTKTTFNPISEPFNHAPVMRPGTSVVLFKNGVAEQVSEFDSVKKVGNIVKRTDNAILIGVSVGALATLFCVWMLFGKWLLLITILAAVSFFVYVFTRRDSSAASMILGPQPMYYLVDMSRHEVLDTRRIQLQDTGVFAEVDIEYMASVRNAALVVKDGVQDVREHLSRRFYSKLGRIAGKGTLTDKLEALRNKLQELSEQVNGDNYFVIEDVTFEVRIEGEIAEDIVKIAQAGVRKQGIEAENSVNESQREYFENLIQDDDKLLAEIMRPRSDKKILLTALQVKIERSGRAALENRKLFEMALDQGIIEQHELEKYYPDFTKNLLRNVSGDGSGTKKLTNDDGKESESDSGKSE